jgi:ribonuclease E
MTEPNEQQERQHWDDLARQLGLEPKKENLPAEPHAGRPAEDETPNEVETEQQNWPEEIEPMESTPDTTLFGTETAPSETGEPGETEERPSRGRRRRGRRGGRGERAANEPEAEGETEPSTAPDESDSDDESAPSHGRRRRGRSRSRRAKDAEPVTEEAALDEEVDEEETPEEEDADEEVDTLSDWNVPSWQELISSLYRPDR